MDWSNPYLQALFWSAVTIAVYVAAKRLHGRVGRWWSAPLLVTPAVLISLALGLHETYREYIHQTHWLVALLGPATVAFAIPIWEQRELIRHRWPVLVIGVMAGSVTAMVSAWYFAEFLGLSESLRMSLLPR